MKKIKILSIYAITALILLITAQSAFCKTVSKDIEFDTKDSRIIKAKLTYASATPSKKYPVVLLLHSIGYSSREWGTLIAKLNNAGLAVLAMDLRGHGQRVYDKTFHKKSWVYFTNKTYQKFQSDVIGILTQAQAQDKNIDTKRLAIVGADIGANTAVLASTQLKTKPKTLVLIAPTESFKGLYIPVSMTKINMPILTMTSTKDKYTLAAQRELAKFSQGGFYAQNYPYGGMGMLMIKVNPSMAGDITKWVAKYLK